MGPACLSLLEIDVVTADGALVTANEHQHADLLWAAPGGRSGLLWRGNEVPSSLASAAQRDSDQ